MKTHQSQETMLAQFKELNQGALELEAKALAAGLKYVGRRLRKQRQYLFDSVIRSLGGAKYYSRRRH